MWRGLFVVAILLALVAGVAACGGDSDDEESAVRQPTPAEEDGARDSYPEVVEVAAEPTGEGTYTFVVTISSPYDSRQRFADGWRILTTDGEAIAEHELLHEHAAEQPFTREQPDVEVPSGVTTVVVEGRDSENGYGGKAKRVELPDSSGG